jgi:uncharacterized protein YndB with AHSA1/START domain
VTDSKPGTGPKLPFSGWWPLLAGAGTGVILRVAFYQRPGQALAAMTGAFIFLSPLLVGAVTVYFAEKRARRNWGYHFTIASVANILYVLGTMAVMIEGLICAVIILPLFAIVGGIGGVIMGVVCRLTRWPKQTLYSLAFLPFAIASLEEGVPLPERITSVERTVEINAPAEEVWRQILDARDIRPEEVGDAWLYRIGVPTPIAGVTRETPGGLVRTVTMGKGIHFDEVFTDWQEYRRLSWTYRFREDSFPPQVLDEHVVIGGMYFDVKDTTYTLAARDAATELTVRMGFRVSTRFNWYAEPVARFLMGNLEETNLDYYRKRSESRRAAAGEPKS